MRKLETIATLMMTLFLAGASQAGGGGGTILTDTNVPPPVVDSSAFEIDTTDYDAECADKAPKDFHGNLVLDSPVDVSDYRCVRTVYGNLVVDSNGNRELVLPWLVRVTGNLVLDGNPQLPSARLPRLYRVDGRIVVDAWSGASTRWEVWELTQHDGTFRVEAGSVTDLRGFDLLEDVGRLELRLLDANAPMNQQTPIFMGLAGLTSVGQLDYDLDAEPAQQTGDFLSSLVEVRGKAEIDTRYWLVGTDAIETIGGKLDVYVKNLYGDAAADGLESLREVGGDFLWSGTDLVDIDALSSLEHVGGSLELPLDVESLAGFANLQSVGGDFSLIGPVDVQNLAELASLFEVGGRLTIEDTGIGSLHGLQGVLALGGLRIHDNDSLGSVAALGNATVAGSSSVVITANAPLTDCQANDLVASMTIPMSTSTTVSGNVSPCISFQQVAPVARKVFQLGR